MGDISKRDIIFKIKKLLAVANGAANLNESLAAAEIAQRLIALHDIEETDLAESELPGGLQESAYDYIAVHQSAFLPALQDPPNYIQFLLKVIAEANQCAVYVAQAKTEKDEIHEVFSIIGKNTNMQIVEFLFFWLFFQIERFFLESAAADRKDFYLGAATALKSRLEKAKEDVAKDVPKEKLEKAMVRLDKSKNEVQSILENLASKFEEQELIKAVDEHSFGKGVAAGSRLIIENNKEISSGIVDKRLNQQN